MTLFELQLCSAPLTLSKTKIASSLCKRTLTGCFSGHCSALYTFQMLNPLLLWSELASLCVAAFYVCGSSFKDGSSKLSAPQLLPSSAEPAPVRELLPSPCRRWKDGEKTTDTGLGTHNMFFHSCEDKHMRRLNGRMNNFRH